MDLQSILHICISMFINNMHTYKQSIDDKAHVVLNKTSEMVTTWRAASKF